MKQLEDKLDKLSGLVVDMDLQIKMMNVRLDQLVKALHDYDNDYEYDEPQRGACSKHDDASWDEIEENERMDIIGQNGNEGLHYNSHYVTNEEANENAITSSMLFEDGYREGYDNLLASGMFFEMYPEWTGEWDKDKDKWMEELDRMINDKPSN
jgi:hypothetical protein